MTTSYSRRAGLALVLSTCVLGSVAVAGQAPGKPRTPETEQAYQELYQYLDAGGGPFRNWDTASLKGLCERWLAFARTAGLPESPVAFLEMQPLLTPELRNDYTIAMTVATLAGKDHPCPPPAVAVAPGSGDDTLGVATIAPAAKGPSKRTLLIGGGAVVLGTGIALAGGGGSDAVAVTPSTTPATTPAVNVTSFHGPYIGRLVTGISSIPGCGRAAVAPCNAQVAGNTTGTAAVVTFGGDLPNTGVLRPDGTLQNLRFEGPANGLGALDGGIVILWQQQGTIAGNTLTLNGTVLVRSAGPCNGATFTTLVEATRN